MRVTLKLFAMLTDFLPASIDSNQRDGNIISFDTAAGTTVMDLILRFKLPANWVHLVLVNGKYVDPDQRAVRVLVEGDVLAIWPPVAGG